jgi:hypothetical protein
MSLKSVIYAKRPTEPLSQLLKNLLSMAKIGLQSYCDAISSIVGTNHADVDSEKSKGMLYYIQSTKIKMYMAILSLYNKMKNKNTTLSEHFQNPIGYS